MGAVGKERRARPTKVVGLGAPISVWIYFEICEAPALVDAIDEELERYAMRAAADVGGASEQDGAADGWQDHIDELRRMRASVTQAKATYTRRFDVVWPTVLAHPVLHHAVAHAQRRAESGDGRAKRAVMAATESRRDFDAVDVGGQGAVWL